MQSTPPNSFLDEILRSPLPFLGGVVAGALKLNLDEDPLRSWLEQQGYTPSASSPQSGDTPSTPSGPQNITIE